MLRSWGRRFMLCVQFLMRVPFHIDLYLQPNDFGGSVFFFPFAVLLVGTTVYGAARLGYLSSSFLVAAAFAMIMQVVCTSGMYLDGMANVMDASRFSERAEKLESMRLHILSNRGKISIGINLLAKGIMLWQLMESVAWMQMWMILLAVSLCSVFALVAVAAFSAAADIEDIWTRYIQGIQPLHFFFVLLVVAVLLILFVGFVLAALLVLFSAVSAIAIKTWFKKRLGGITRDVMGFTHEWAQLLSYGIIWTVLQSQWISIEGFIPVLF